MLELEEIFVFFFWGILTGFVLVTDILEFALDYVLGLDSLILRELSVGKELENQVVLLVDLQDDALVVLDTRALLEHLLQLLHQGVFMMDQLEQVPVDRDCLY